MKASLGLIIILFGLFIVEVCLFITDPLTSFQWGMVYVVAVFLCGVAAFICHELK